eukprot:875556-Amphidinium_carterae.1
MERTQKNSPVGLRVGHHWEKTQKNSPELHVSLECLWGTASFCAARRSGYAAILWSVGGSLRQSWTSASRKCRRPQCGREGLAP